MFVRNKRHLVVDCYPPAKVRLLWLLIVALLAALAWSIWGYAPAQVKQQLQTVEAQHLQLMERFSSGETARKRLRAEVERLRSLQQVDTVAYELLQKNFNTLQDGLVEAKQQLAFYHAVVAPEQDKAGLKIQGFKVDSAVGGRYPYSLVLIQAQKTQTMVKGTLRLEVGGSLNGHQKMLPMATVTRPAVGEAKLQFRYFQNINGQLEFPPGFSPERVKLTLDVNYPHKDVKKSYSWSRLRGG